MKWGKGSASSVAGAGAPRVPAFPVLSAEVDEEGVAWFQGRRVELRAGEEPASAVMRLSAEAAAAREGSVKAVRVRAVNEGSAWDLIVDGSGEVWDAPAAPRTPVNRRQKAGLAALLAGVLVMPVAAAAVVLGPGLAGSAEETGPVRTVTVSAAGPTPTQLPVLAPSGSQVVALWSSEPLATAGADAFGMASPAVGLGSCVATVVRVGQDGVVRCLRADTGAPAWSTKADSAGASLWPVAGGVLVTSSSQVRVLDPTGRVMSSRSLRGGERPVVIGSGAVIQSSKTSVLIEVDGRWAPRVVPAGAEVVGVQGKAAVMADRSGQVWAVTDPRVAASSTRLRAPSKGAISVGVVGLTPDGFLQGWQTPSKELVIERYRLASLSKPVMSVKVPVTSSWSASQVTGKTAVSPGGLLAVVADHLVDLVAGTAQKLPDGWRTTRLLDSQAFGQARGAVVVVDAQARALWSVEPPSGVDVGVPVAQISGISFIPAGVGTESRLYATRTLPSGRSAAAQTPASPTSTAKGGDAK